MNWEMKFIVFSNYYGQNKWITVVEQVNQLVTLRELNQWENI